jgi:hypothetical protein
MITKAKFKSQGALASQDELVTLGLMGYQRIYKEDI